jgi:hypothetical protein
MKLRFLDSDALALLTRVLDSLFAIFLLFFFPGGGCGGFLFVDASSDWRFLMLNLNINCY